jgi:hypothetical protein
VLQRRPRAAFGAEIQKLVNKESRMLSALLSRRENSARNRASKESIRVFV